MRPFERAYVLAYDYSVVLVKKLYSNLTFRGYKKPVNSIRFGGKRKVVIFVIKAFAILLTPVGLMRLLYLNSKRTSNAEVDAKNGYRIRFDNADKVLVFLAPIDWSYRHQRPQNLAESLAKSGYQVVYINPTIEYGLGSKDEITTTQVNGVLVSTIRSTYRGKRFYIGVEGFPNLLAEGIAKLVEELITNKFYSSAIIVVGQPSWWPLVERMQGNQVLFDCMDLHAGFELIDPLNVVHEKSLDITADNIVVTSDFLQNSKSIQLRGAKSVAVIRNGVDSFHFTSDAKPGTEVVVGYFGALAEWFDIDLVKHLVETKPRVSFEFIGHISNPDIFNRLEKYPNVSFLGEVPNKDLPALVRTWKVGLIPFKLSPLILATNPVKMYEYASMGIPIVATQIPEVEHASRQIDGVFVSNSYEEFVQKVDLAVGFPAVEREHLSSWGKNQDWTKRANELLVHSSVVPKVSIIVLMWNQGLMTIKCLQSITQRSDYPNLEIILVDNGSNVEESTLVVNWLESQSVKDIRYIRNSTNLGFAGGNNVGLSQATGDYLVILNNDTEVSPGWIWRSLKHFYRNPNLGLLGPSTNNCGNEARIKLHVAEHDWLSEVVPRFNFRVPHLIQANTVAFFCTFMPRKVFNEIGLISEDFGRGYFEDDDYCRRIQKAGYAIGIARDVFIYHKMGASFNLMKDSEKSQLFYENKLKYEAKWGTWEPHTYAFDADQA
jgi:GT2 family glycosyltransferase/glycosyltransferase involved in cell wall biosynthesis